MTKQEFLDQLRARLSGLPSEDIEERLAFYREMIDDRIEEGASEEDAVAGIGRVEEIAEQIVADTPIAKLAKEKIKRKRRLRAWEIVLLALGSPVWVPLLAAALVVLLAVYVVIWSVAISLWAIFASLSACAPVGVAIGVLWICQGSVWLGLALIGLGLVCAGLSIFLFFGCKAATKGLIFLTAKSALGLKKCLMRKEKEA